MHVLIIGGNLFIGRELVALLRAAGHQITILHRRPSHNLGPGIANIQADRNDAALMREILARDQFDWIFDNVYDWERGTTAEMVAGPAAACGPRLRRYVFMSSVAAYGEGLDHNEDDPLAPPDFPDPYVANKANTERALFRLHRETGFPVTTLRPPFVYGPGNPYYREQFFWDRLRDGRPIILPSGGSRLMQFVFVRDLARACLLAAEREAALGKAFNIADAPISQRDLVHTLAQVARLPLTTVSIPREELLAAGGHPLSPPYYFAQYYDLPPITQQTGRMRTLLGLTLTPFPDGLQEEYAWYLSLARAPQDYSWEDAILARYHAR